MLQLTELTEGPLAAEIAPYLVSVDSEAIASILNRKDIPAKKALSAHDIRQYLMLNDLLLAIEASTQPSCVAATRALDVFPLFDLANPVILAKFEQVLNGLVTETTIPDFTEQHKTEILALGSTLVSRAEQLGIQATDLDVRKVLWNADGSKSV